MPYGNMCRPQVDASASIRTTISQRWGTTLYAVETEGGTYTASQQ